MRKRVSLTTKQQKLVKAVIANPNATLKELGKKSNYSDTTAVFKALNTPKLQAKLKEMMEDHPRLRGNRLLDKLADGLEATKTVTASFNGQITDEREYVDYSARHSYLNMALNLRGDLTKDAGSTTNVQLNFIDLLAEQSKQRGLEYHGSDKAP